MAADVPLFVVARSMTEIFTWAMANCVPYGTYRMVMSPRDLESAPEGAPYLLLGGWAEYTQVDVTMKALRDHKLRPATSEDIPQAHEVLPQ